MIKCPNWGFCFSILLAASGVAAEMQVEITAKSFVADDSQRRATLSGEVVVSQGADRLTADRLVVFFDTQRRPLSYDAEGNVRFAIRLLDGRAFRGSSEKAFYSVSNGRYRLEGNAFLEEIGKTNTLRGHEITIDRSSGLLNVAGDQDRPARLIFSLDNNGSKLIPAPQAESNHSVGDGR